MFIHFFRPVCIFVIINLTNSITLFSEQGYEEFETNPYISTEERECVRPYLLPSLHPIKDSLDSIFHYYRATLNKETLIEAGFSIKYTKERSYIVVASHPELKGFLIKAHLDTELREKWDIPGWRWFVNRIEGATDISNAIKKINTPYFTVPKKWIYPLPASPFPSDPTLLSRKNVILIVEDMELESEKENVMAWKKCITEKHLDDFYAIIKEAGGSSYRKDNVCLTKYGTFAFIDTEYPRQKPSYHWIEPALSSEMRQYWRTITESDDEDWYK